LFIIVAIFDKIYDLHRKMSMPTSVSVNLLFYQRNLFAQQKNLAIVVWVLP